MLQVGQFLPKWRVDDDATGLLPFACNSVLLFFIFVLVFCVSNCMFLLFFSFLLPSGSCFVNGKVTEWALIAVKIGAVAFYWFGVIPAMLAIIMFEVIYVPIRVDANQSPVKSPLKVWHPRFLPFLF
jgi:hypothetical protein